MQRASYSPGSSTRLPRQKMSVLKLKLAPSDTKGLPWYFRQARIAVPGVLPDADYAQVMLKLQQAMQAMLNNLVAGLPTAAPDTAQLSFCLDNPEWWVADGITNVCIEFCCTQQLAAAVDQQLDAQAALTLPAPYSTPDFAAKATLSMGDTHHKRPDKAYFRAVQINGINVQLSDAALMRTWSALCSSSSSSSSNSSGSSSNGSSSNSEAQQLESSRHPTCQVAHSQPAAS